MALVPVLQIGTPRPGAEKAVGAGGRIRLWRQRNGGLSSDSFLHMGRFSLWAEPPFPPTIRASNPVRGTISSPLTDSWVRKTRTPWGALLHGTAVWEPRGGRCGVRPRLALPLLCHLRLPTAALWGGYSDPQSVDGELDAQGGPVSCPCHTASGQRNWDSNPHSQ